jgi:hypothetical protein
MAHVDIDPAAVEKETAVSSGLVPSSRMQVNQAKALILKQPIPHARQDLIAASVRLHQASVFSLKTSDAVSHGIVEITGRLF